MTGTKKDKLEITADLQSFHLSDPASGVVPILKSDLYFILYILVC